MNISPITNSYPYNNRYGTKNDYNSQYYNPSFKLSIPEDKLLRSLYRNNVQIGQNVSINKSGLLEAVLKYKGRLSPEFISILEELVCREGALNLNENSNAEEVINTLYNSFAEKENKNSKSDNVSKSKTYYGIKEVDDYLNEIIKKYSINENSIIKENITFPLPKPNLEYEKIYLKCLSSDRDPNEVFGMVVNENRRSDSSAIDSTLLKIIQHKDFDPNEKYSGGYNVSCNPIFILTTLDKPYLLQEALKLPKADPNIISGNSLTPLYRAVTNNILDCAYVLLKSGKVSKSEIQRCKNCSDLTDEMRGLLDSYPNIDEYVNKSLKGLVELSKVNINTLNDVLTTPNVDPKFVDTNGNNILHIAPLLGNDEAIILAATAINNKVDVNCVNKESKTPLQIALDKKQYELAGFLIEKGADTSKIQDSMQNSFAHIALLINDEEEAIRLLDCAADKGANLNTVNIAKVTPCINAVKMRKYRILNYLINKGVKINAQDMNGMTALHYACMLNDKKSLEILLNNFANQNIKNNVGITPDKYIKQKDLLDFYNMFKTIM